MRAVARAEQARHELELALLLVVPANHRVYRGIGPEKAERPAGLLGIVARLRRRRTIKARDERGDLCTGPHVIERQDFEAVAGLAGRSHKPEHAWREFAERAAGEMPPQLVRVAELTMSFVRPPPETP